MDKQTAKDDMMNIAAKLPLALALAAWIGAAGAGESLLADKPLPAVQPAGAEHEYCPPPPPPEAAELPEADELAAGYCPPPPPVASYCPPPPPTPYCPPVATEMVAVPVKKRVVEEECYVVNETRREMVDELRTRTLVRQVPALKTRMVSEAKIVKLASASGRATRLARGVERGVKVYKSHEPEEYTETYSVKVPNVHIVPVAKTRKVTRLVDDVKFVERRLRSE